MKIIFMTLIILGIIAFGVFFNSSLDSDFFLGFGIVFAFIVVLLSIFALVIYVEYSIGDYYSFMKRSEVTKTVEANGETTEMYISVDGKEYHFVFNEEEEKHD